MLWQQPYSDSMIDHVHIYPTMAMQVEGKLKKLIYTFEDRNEELWNKEPAATVQLKHNVALTCVSQFACNRVIAY